MSMTIPKDNKEFIKRFVDVVFNCDIQYEMDSDDLTRIEKETYKQLKHKPELLKNTSFNIIIPVRWD